MMGKIWNQLLGPLPEIGDLAQTPMIGFHLKVEHLATSGVIWKCGIPQKPPGFHSSTIVSLIETTHLSFKTYQNSQI